MQIATVYTTRANICKGEKMEFKHNQEIKIFKALADENRLAIMELLMNGSMCGCELLEALNISQSTLSHHMHILCDAELVEVRKVGKWMHYSLSPCGVARMHEWMERYTTADTKEV